MDKQDPIQESAERLAVLIQRAAGADDEREHTDHMEMVDDEVVDALAGLDHAQRLGAMDQIMKHLDQQGLPTELVEEVFSWSKVSRPELDAWRMDQATRQARPGSAAARI